MSSPYLRIFVVLFSTCICAACTSSTELKWQQEDGYRWAELSPGYFGSVGFSPIDPSSSNITFSNNADKKSISENRNYLNGSGVAAADVDADGLVDLYFAQLDGPNRLYKNMGNMTFKDITDKAGVAHEGYNSSGVVFADVDGDRDSDLLITSLTEGNELYINDGKGTFTIKNNSGLGPSRGSNTMALADIDSDGDLDLYITNYKLKSVRDIYSAEELTTENTLRKEGDSLVVVPPFDQHYGIVRAGAQVYRNEYGARDELYINNGNGVFKKVLKTGERFLDYSGNPEGLSRDWGLTAKFQDINGDRLPDLYVANDFWTPDRIWINQGEGIFKGIDRNAVRSLSFSSMGVDFSDINRDGSLDIFVTEMLSADHHRRMRQLSEYLGQIQGRPQYNRNSLYLNRGDDTFAEISYYSNLEATEWSWATNFLDVDLDGFEDLIITTGHSYDYQDIDTQLEMDSRIGESRPADQEMMTYPRLPLQNKIFRNNSNLTFSDRSTDWGFQEEDISLGMAIADLDLDGDPDLALNRLNREAALYENGINAPRIAVLLVGDPANSAGIGAKVELLGAGTPQQKEISDGGTYVSDSEPTVFFAAEEDNVNHTIKVSWPDGTISKVDSVGPNRIYEVEKGPAGQNIQADSTDTSDPTVMFEDVSGMISHIHYEDPYTDYNIQALLPVKISERGPGISWIDYNRDGFDDLFISSGKGGRVGVFQNDGEGTLTRVRIEKLTRVAPGDQTTILGWGVSDGLNLVVGSANFEQGNPRAPSSYQYRLEDEGYVTDLQSIPGILSTTGPLAAADYDGDGDIDLFVGGSYNPAQYPKDASSRIFKNEKGTFQLDRVNSRKLSEIGLVTGALFSDYDMDGDQDLLISREWDSILLFENQNGNFRDVTSETGLDAWKGWWNGITAGDFNNDGLPDIIATNMGRNSVYQMDTDFPLKLFYEDFNRDGKLDIVDAYYNPSVEAYVPRRKLYEFDSVPVIRQFVGSHEAFARSSVEEVFGRNFSGIPSKEINTLRHMMFINTGNGFEATPLPRETQFTTAFHAAVSDFNSDGNEDLFLSQNLFALPSRIPRQDAGRGILLKGDGEGAFETIPGHKSGLRIYGEQRGASVSDFNGDGKPDIAVSQNKSDTRLYLNHSDRRGLRIRLIGPSDNRDSIGSAMRVSYQNGSKGPLREIRAGSGHWSQRSAIQVMGTNPEKTPASLEIYWNNGARETVKLVRGKTDYTLSAE